MKEEQVVAVNKETQLASFSSRSTWQPPPRPNKIELHLSLYPWEWPEPSGEKQPPTLAPRRSLIKTSTRPSTRPQARQHPKSIKRTVRPSAEATTAATAMFFVLRSPCDKFNLGGSRATTSSGEGRVLFAGPSR